MKLAVLFLILSCLVLAVIVQQIPGSQTPTVSYSPEFKTKAREAIAAIERLQYYSGVLPEFEADKAMDALRETSKTYGEDNACNVISQYKLAIRVSTIGTTRKQWERSQAKDKFKISFPDLQKARADVWAIEANLR